MRQLLAATLIVLGHTREALALVRSRREWSWRCSEYLPHGVSLANGGVESIRRGHNLTGADSTPRCRGRGVATMMANDMALKPRLSIMFDGQCEAAFRFYERCLSGTISFMLMWGHSPAAAEVPPDWAGKVYHATLKVGDFVMTGGDLPADKYEKPKGFSIVLGIDNPAAAERIFDELAQNGRIAMPLQETFWASRYGALVDKFGIAWEVNCERPAADPE